MPILIFFGTIELVGRPTITHVKVAEQRGGQGNWGRVFAVKLFCNLITLKFKVELEVEARNFNYKLYL